MIRYLRLISRLLLGIVFIFSGFVKAVDPLGSAYKFSDYFNAFRLGFLDFSALPLSVGLSAFEMTMGIVLLIGYRRKIIYGILMWFMTFFTLLTFILALFNPVSDCGCFGDALILTNWETFLKNLILMVFVLLLYSGRNNEWKGRSPFREWSVVAVLFAGVALFSVWNHRHLPLVDFRPYDIGTVIREEMEIPEGEPMDEYETTFIYRNRETGDTETFTIDNYPTDTMQWEFVDSKSRLVKKGFEPPIHDFVIFDENGYDVVQEILDNRDYSLLMVSHDLSDADPNALLRAKGWSELELLADDYRFYAATASPSGEAASIAVNLDLGYSFLMADDIMLKTVVRSNPGFILIRNGIIVGKWGYRDFPAIEELEPAWSELVENAAAPLLEAGITEAFSYDVIDFDQFMPALVYEAGTKGREKDVVVVLILGILVVIMLSNAVEPIRMI